MGKKRRGHPTVEDLLARPWCYYCERDFEDLKLLISHQKAKHFKCDRCGRRLNTAGGLSVHMNQVHKESLSSVENALPNRSGLDVEIFGMEGIPEDVVQQHNQRIIQNFYQAQADRYEATGNPPPGQGGGTGNNPPKKKVKIESADEIKNRLAEFRKLKMSQPAAGGAATAPVGANATAVATEGVTAAPTHTPPVGLSDGQSPGQNNSPFPPPGQFSPGFPPQFPPQAGFNFSPSNLPTRPGNGIPPPGLPSRPGQPGFPGAYPGAPYNSSGVADYSAGGSAGHGDDIDQIIRMAEAGIKPLGKKADESHLLPGATEGEKEKKGKKDKGNVRMVYDDDISPEERLASMPKYAFVPAAA